MSTLQYIGIAAGILTSASLIPQLVKMIRKKQAEDLSPLMMTILSIGLALWVVYGIKKDDQPIIYTNSFSLLLNGMMIFLRYRYKNRG